MVTDAELAEIRARWDERIPYYSLEKRDVNRLLELVDAQAARLGTCTVCHRLYRQMLIALGPLAALIGDQMMEDVSGKPCRDEDKVGIFVFAGDIRRAAKVVTEARMMEPC